jgi:type II secretion system protein I
MRIRTNSGFTLLEILVATAILGTAVAALFGLLSTALGNMQRLQAPSQALMLGQSRMNELLAAGLEATVPMPLDQRVQGRWNGQFRWEALATRFNPPPNLAPGQLILVRIVLDVFWLPAPGKPEKKLSLESYQLQQEPLRTSQ